MKKLIKNILGWGIIGFIAGLIIAPEKGEETRKKIKEAFDKGKEKFEEIKSKKEGE